MKKILCSGGIGDVFIVYCKLYYHWQKNKTPFSLQRYDKELNYDKPLNEFFKAIPFVRYEKCKGMNELERDLKKHIYIQASADGEVFYTGAGNDPKEFLMNPYPKVFLKKKTFKKPTVGIQLQTGKKVGNFKGFSLAWIKKIVASHPDKNFILLGTGVSYSGKQLEKFCKENNITNLVKKTTFTQWMSTIMGLDFYITPEGFSAFFALSQKVPCFVYYVHSVDLRRIHSKWKKHGVFEQVTSKIQLKYLLRGRLVQRIFPSFEVESALGVDK